MKRNLDPEVVKSFGDEWKRFDQEKMSEDESHFLFNKYFAIFPWSRLPKNAVGFDMGCGSGRWARLVAPKVGHLYCIDPSDALDLAQRLLVGTRNVSFIRASVDDQSLPPESQDYGYSLGVLHHLPDPESGVRECVKMLKPGAPFLVYMYYAFDNRSALFRFVWWCSDLLRRMISHMPSGMKHIVTDFLALVVYLPLARTSKLLDRIGVDISSIPLSFYRDRSWHMMRTDSRDRFGTPLEKRFSRVQIQVLLESAGLSDIRFSEDAPYWCAVGIKA